MNKPEVWTLEKLATFDFKNAAIWTRPYLRHRVERRISLPIIEDKEEPSRDLDTLIVIGGGVLIDRAKVWRKENRPEMRLIAIPSIWGSGAENSPIAILNEGDKKIVKIGPEFLPDVRVIWVELAEGLPADLVKYACGDVWAHTLEGFLSPIANDEVRNELADVIKSLEKLPLGNNPMWFEISARACAGQAKSSVGLVHGIAHTLEGLLKLKYPQEYFGHAQLCATYLWPVFSLNMQHSDKLDRMFDLYKIDKVKVVEIIKQLFDEHIYDLGLPVLQENWRSVLREPTSRTNCVLVKSDYLSHFILKRFK
jgi:alcohol dehydrogenase class IV